MACGSGNNLLPACKSNIGRWVLNMLNAYSYYGPVRCGTSDLLYLLQDTFLHLSPIPPSRHLFTPISPSNLLSAMSKPIVPKIPLRT